MASEKRLIDANRALEIVRDQGHKHPNAYHLTNYATLILREAPTVDAVEVVHGRWERCGGDLHSSGYAIYCSVCNKTHFVHYEYSLGGLYGHKELFELPNYCPNCGAKMDGDGNG